MNIVTDYEVEGGWAAKGHKTRCRNCGALLELTPLKDHYNSQYWHLKRNDGYDLYNCPKGCSIEDANKSMTLFLYIREYCTEDSTSYDWKPDFNKFVNCWISPDGTIYPVSSEGHVDFAYLYTTVFYPMCRQNAQIYLEEQGWLKISRVMSWFAIGKYTFTKQQKNSIFDYCVAEELDTKNIFTEENTFEIEFRRKK